MSKRKKEVKAQVRFGRVETKDIKAVQEVIDQQIERNKPAPYTQISGLETQVGSPKVPRIVGGLNTLDRTITSLEEELHNLCNSLEPIRARREQSADPGIQPVPEKVSKISVCVELACRRVMRLCGMVNFIKSDLEI